MINNGAGTTSTSSERKIVEQKCTPSACREHPYNQQAVVPTCCLKLLLVPLLVLVLQLQGQLPALAAVALAYLASAAAVAWLLASTAYLTWPWWSRPSAGTEMKAHQWDSTAFSPRSARNAAASDQKVFGQTPPVSGLALLQRALQSHTHHIARLVPSASRMALG